MFISFYTGILASKSLNSIVGAAFASRDALQQIVLTCLNQSESSDIRSLPNEWSHRLIDEISLNEKVRNSTLRRSTGYALGFLAIMRSYVAAKTEQRDVCTSILHQLLKLSLPPKKRIDKSLENLNAFGGRIDCNNIFVYATSPCTSQSYVLDSQYEVSSYTKMAHIHYTFSTIDLFKFYECSRLDAESTLLMFYE